MRAHGVIRTLTLLFSLMGMTLAANDARAAAPCSPQGAHFAEIRELVRAVDEFPEENPLSLAAVYGLLYKLELVKDRPEIQDFRCLDSLTTIRKLLTFSRVDERAIRVRASLLMANVVDNTTVCAVINELYEETLDDNVRYNLWQIVRVVALYARVENRNWITQALENNREMLVGKSDYGKTKRMMELVEERLGMNTARRMLRDEFPDQYRECIRLNNIEPVDE